MLDANWIHCKENIGDCVPLYKKDFKITHPIKSAFLYISLLTFNASRIWAQKALQEKVTKSAKTEVNKKFILTEESDLNLYKRALELKDEIIATHKYYITKA